MFLVLVLKSVILMRDHHLSVLMCFLVVKCKWVICLIGMIVISQVTNDLEKSTEYNEALRKHISRFKDCSCCLDKNEWVGTIITNLFEYLQAASENWLSNFNSSSIISEETFELG